MPENKSKFLIPVVGAVVVVVGSVAAYMYLRGPAGDGAGALSSAKLVPSSALMATYISTDPKSWAKLQQFGTPEAQKLVTQGLEDFNKNVLTSNDISYEKDIQPWVGGLMIAVLPPQQTQSNPSGIQRQPEPQVLMIAGIRDKLSALNFANKLKGQKGVKTKESDYKGEKIIETSTENNSSPTYSAVLNNSYVVFSPQRPVVEKAIDTYKGQPSFITKDGANLVFNKGVDVQNSLAQIYIPDYAGMIQQIAATSPSGTALTPQTIKQLQQVKSMVAAVGVDNEGVRFKAIANLDPTKNKFQYQNSPAKIVGQFPTETFALITGQGISQTWKTIVEQSNEYPEFKQGLEQTRSQLKTANFDLDKDIFGWMDGEFALGAVPSDKDILASVGFGGAMVFDTSDRQTAAATLAKLDNLAKTQSITVATKNVNGKDITEWQIPQQGALFAHGWLDQDTVFLAVGGPVAEALVNKNQTLENSESFKTITSSLQKPNGGYFYLDMDKTMSIVNRFAAQSQQPIPPEANAILSSIRGIGVTAVSPDQSTSQIEMLLALKPSK
ncbi:DUF3352 domain-containing protein [Aliinostoc sp. HNIBRCY26]|uniref:DUF3352 domain-containing protein n=1 Tax=Aliinostoc sp. HNIBRCY26 TaxID=3418997 RepID=UPI003CFE4BA7